MISETVDKINLRFTSGNSVPVDSVRITREEWEALIAERDAALEREQALAAHVEGLRQYIGQWGDGYVSDEVMMSRLFKWAASPADGSLAHRDLIKQAEALEEEAKGWPEDKYTESSHVRESIEESAEKLRNTAQLLK